MTGGAPDVQAVAMEAQGFFDIPISDLQRKLEDVVAVLEANTVPQRGIDRQFWRGARARLAKKIAAQTDAAAATAGVAAAEVVAWADDVGLDLTEYRVPLAILTALVVRSVWDQLGDREDPSPKPSEE